MSAATSTQPTSATGPASVLSSAPGVSPSAVSAAIQAIKDAGVNSASAGNQIQQDPQLMSALLTLIQNQAQKVRDNLTSPPCTDRKSTRLNSSH